MPDSRPEVLFVCVHNAGRSQMAAALLAHHGGERIVVRSAGSAPADDLNPAVIEAMAELGIDLRAAGARPKKLEDAAVQASDVVITMGCGDACTIYPGKRYEDWKLDDPAGQGVDAVRPIRDEIDRRVLALLVSLGIDLHASGAHPKKLDDAAVRASDVVITMGCGDECPFYPGKRYLDWALPDPAGQGVEAVRPIRDEIDRRVRALLAELTAVQP